MAARDNLTAQLDALSSPLTGQGRRPMAKADLRKPDIDWRAQIGAAIRTTRGALTLKEFAAAIKRDERQVGRWEDGKERPQLDAISAVPDFREPLILAIARLSKSVRVRTVITLRRTG